MSNPHRTVIVTGFVGANLAGVMTAVIFHDFASFLRGYLLGGFLALGLAGMLAGTFFGMLLRLVQEKMVGPDSSWTLSLLTTSLAAGGVGVLAVLTVFSLLEVK